MDKKTEESIDSQDLVSEYEKRHLSEEITPFEDVVGFSLLCDYPKETEYFQSGRKMFIKIYITPGNKVAGSITMVEPMNTERGGYRVISTNELNSITNFRTEKNDELIFNPQNKTIVQVSKDIYLSVNDFVEILKNNHLSDKHFWNRKKNFLVRRFLQFIFWLSDKSYESVGLMFFKEYQESKDDHAQEDEKNIEPFFKYFYISKNILFFILLVLFPISYSITSLKYSLSNPTIVLIIFLLLFSLEKASLFLDVKIKDFFRQKENFIDKLHKYQYENRFKLDFTLKN